MKYLRHTAFLRELGARIRLIRENKGISQQELSYRIDISRNQLGRIERGEINTGVSTLYEIAEGLQVGVCEFFKKEDK
jgi:transcriptional regulator with XRE-family HTH domain